jgi:hypothetical protein
VLLSDYLRQRGRPGVAAMVEEAERAAREPGAAGGLPELRWAPYQEFGIPDPAAETHEPPAVAVTVGATGYRGNDIIVYWTPAEPQPAPGLAALIEDWRDTLDELADMSDDAHPRGKAGRETETGVLRTVIAQAEKISGGAAPGLAEAVTEARAHQALIAEILSHFGPSGSGHTARVGQVQITRWLKRAGIEQP